MKRTILHAVLMALLSQADGASAASDSQWTRCARLATDRARLACFEAAAARRRRQEAPRFRVSLGYGLGIASHQGSFVVSHGKLDLKSGLGNAGDTYYAQSWMRSSRDWTVGVEYLRLQNTGNIALNLPNGLSIFTDPVTGSVHDYVKADMAFFNLAWQPSGLAPWRSYVGAGLGVGTGSGHFSLDLANDFIPAGVHSLSNGSAVFAGLQGFIGTDIPVSNHYYLGLQGKVIWVTAHPVGLDQRYLDFVFGISLGRSF